MTVNLFSFVRLYSHGLTTLLNILEKSAAHERNAGSTGETFLDWRLAEDMFPLRRQAQIVCDFAGQWPARAAGAELPPALHGNSSLAELEEAAATALAFLETLRPDQFAGRDDEMLTLDIGGMEPTMPIGRWVTGFATTNFYFHLSMAYAIARHKGVSLGKRDFFAAGL